MYRRSDVTNILNGKYKSSNTASFPPSERYELSSCINRSALISKMHDLYRRNNKISRHLMSIPNNAGYEEYFVIHSKNRMVIEGYSRLMKAKMLFSVIGGIIDLVMGYRYKKSYGIKGMVCEIFIKYETDILAISMKSIFGDDLTDEKRKELVIGDDSSKKSSTTSSITNITGGVVTVIVDKFVGNDSVVSQGIKSIIKAITDVMGNDLDAVDKSDNIIDSAVTGLSSFMGIPTETASPVRAQATERGKEGSPRSTRTRFTSRSDDED